MDSPIPDDKSFPRFSSLSFITFSEDDWKLSSPSLTPVQSDADWTEESTTDNSQQRPEELRCLWHEIGFTFSIAMSQILTEYFVSGFTVILPGLVQGHVIPESSSVWPASMFSLAVAATTLVFGRLADMYGGRRIYICGSVWLAVWSLIIGFARREILLDLSRAFQGIGASAMLPSGLMMMGCIYRPGKRKNMVFSIYGACAPFGFLSLFTSLRSAKRGE